MKEEEAAQQPEFGVWASSDEEALIAKLGEFNPALRTLLTEPSRTTTTSCQRSSWLMSFGGQMRDTLKVTRPSSRSCYLFLKTAMKPATDMFVI